MPTTSLAPLSRNDRVVGGITYRNCTFAAHEGDRLLERSDANFYHRSTGTIDVWCRSCVRAYNRQRRIERAAGNVVRTIRARKFGVEIEFVGDADALMAQMRERGLTVSMPGYTHSVLSSWKIVSDGSLSLGWELVSPPLTAKDQLEKACEALAAAGCTVNRQCGLHVHHDVGDLSAQQIGRLFRGWSNAQSAIDQMLAPSRRNTNWARPLAAREVEHIERLQATDRTTVRSHFRHSDRYRALNVACYPRYGTVEVRQHQGTTNFAKISAWIDFGQAIINRAKSAADQPLEGNAHALLDTLAAHGLAAEQATYLKARADFFLHPAARVAA